MAAAIAVLSVISAGLLASAQPASAAIFATISGAGSTEAANAINSWVNSVAQSGLQVNYSAVGSTTGRNFFKQGIVNFAVSEIPYGLQDGNNFDPPPARGYTYMPVVAGGLSFMYNLSIGGHRVTGLRLSGAAIAGIFTGQITMWNDPVIAADNPGLAMPATQVIPVVRSDGSGGTEVLTQWMAATQGPAWTAYCALVGRSPCTPTSAYPVDSQDPAMVGQQGDAGVSGYVAQSQANGAIGYTAYAYALQAGFPVAKVLNSAGFYTVPTPGHVGVSLLNAQVNNNPSDPLYQTADLSQVYTDTDPRTYELSYYTYMILPTDNTALSANQGFSLGAFGSFALCQGQQQVDNLGYSALPVNLVETGFAQLQRVPGASLPATTSAFIQSCNNPTFSPDGTNRLATTDPMPPACDQQGTVQCTAIDTSGPVSTITTVTVSPNPAPAGLPVTLTATVAPVGGGATPTGSVQFEVGGTIIGSPVALDSGGVATTTDTFTTAGTLVVVSAMFTPADASAFTASTGNVSIATVVAATSAMQTLTTTVPPSGTFTLSVASTDTITMTASGATATGAMIPVTVSDTRNTYPGWSVSGQASDFTAAGTQPDKPIPGNQLGWTPTSTTLAAGAALGPPVAPATPGLGTIAAILAIASAGGGVGTSTLGADLMLAIPPATPSGAYAGVLTLTANPTGP
jgi:phosphate ABC transporter phosphate-binding protein